MHARHRGIGDGARLNSVSGQVYGEGSIQGHWKNNWEYRNFNRGFGGVPPKSYPLPPKPPPHKGDIFMEAGRLAAEYLVSKGLLPHNLLPGKWQNGYLKGHQMGNFQEFRAQVRENPMLFSEGRNCGFAQVGNVFPEGVSARRRFHDEFSSMGHKNQMRGKRRMGSYRGLGSDWGRENGRKRHCSEKTRALPDMLEGGDDSVGLPYQGEPQVGLDVGGRASKVITHEMALKSEIVGNSKSKQEAHEFPDEADSKASSSSARRDLLPEDDIELSKGLDHVDVLNSDIKEVSESKFDDKIEEETAQENFEKQHCLVEEEPLSKHGSNLLQFCSFSGRVPTRARSLLASRLSRVGQGPRNEERNGCDIAPASRSNVPIEEDSVKASALSLKSSTSDISRVHSVRSWDEAVDVDAAFIQERERCTSSHTLSDGSSSMHQEDSDDGPPGFVTCKPVVLLNEGNCSANHVRSREVDKRPRESPSRTKITREEDSVEASTLNTKSLTSDISGVHSVPSLNEAVDSDATFVAGTERCTRSQSFSDVASSMHQEDVSDGPPGFVTCKPLALPNEGDISRVHAVPSLNEAVDTDATFVVGTERCTRSQSFSDVASSMHQEDASDCPSGFVTCKPMVLPNEGDVCRVHSASSLNEAVDSDATFVSGTERCTRSQSFSDVGSSMHQKDASDGPLGFVTCKPMVLPNEGDIYRVHSVPSLNEAVDSDATFVAGTERCTSSQSLSDVASSMHQKDASDGPPGFVTYIPMVLPNEGDTCRVHSVPSLNEAVDSDAAFVAVTERCTRSQSFSDVAMHQEAVSDGPSGFVTCKPMVLPNKGDSYEHHVGTWVAYKRPGESLSGSRVPGEEDSVLDAPFVAGSEGRTRSQSFSDVSSSMHQEDASDCPLGFVKCKSMFLPNKGDSSVIHVGKWEAEKRPGELRSVSKVQREENSIQASIHSMKNLSSDIPGVLTFKSFDEAVDLDAPFDVEPERCKRSQSFLVGSSSMPKEDESDGPPGFVSCKSVVLPNSGNSSAHQVGAWEAGNSPGELPTGSKVPREEDSIQACIHGRKRCTGSQSFSDGSSFMRQEELSDGLPGFERCNTSVILNKANSLTHFVGTSVEIKRHRESPAPRKEHSVQLSADSTIHLTSDASKVRSAESLGEVLDAFVEKGERFSRSQSFSDGSSFIHQEESSDGLSEFVRCNSMVLPSKGDSFVNHVGSWETTKRPRESPFSEVSGADEHVLLHKLRAKQLHVEAERLSCSVKMVESADQKTLVEGGFAPKSGAECEFAAKEENYPLPSMLKICDLNLLDASEIAQSPDDLIQDHVSSAPCASGVEKEAARDVDFLMISNSDLSMISNSLSYFDDYDRLVSDANEATRVNVANNSLIKEKVFDNAGQKTETMYPSIEHVLNHMDNTVDLPDDQDAYGNDISRPLGTDISNCSSVSADIDDLHSQISLHGQGGIPVIDDPINLAFGEMPFSFFGVWDQPTQDYGEPF